MDLGWYERNAREWDSCPVGIFRALLDGVFVMR